MAEGPKTQMTARRKARKRALDGLGKPGILAGPDEETLAKAYAEVAR